MEVTSAIRPIASRTTAANRDEGYLLVRDAMREFYPRFSDEEYRRRYRLIYEMMDSRGLDCLLIYGDSGTCFLNEQNVHYVANYIDEMYSYVVFPRHGDPTLYVSIPPDQAAAMACSVIDDVRPGGMGPAMAGKVAIQLKEQRLNGKRIGIVDNMAIAPGLPHAHFEVLTETLPRAEFPNVTDEYEELRAIPSAEEMEWFKKGIELTDKAAMALVDAAEPGRTEAELWGAVHSAYLQLGGSFCFCILGSTPMADPRMSYPHGISNMGALRPIQQGDFIVCELSGSYYGYSGHCFSLVALGEPPDYYWEMYNFSLQIYTDIANVLKAGNTTDDVLTIAQRIPENGFDIEAPLIHAWGTHWGAPTVGRDDDGAIVSWYKDVVEFRTDQLIAIHPSVCTPDTLLGVELGNMVQVGADGPISLHQCGTELIVK